MDEFWDKPGPGKLERRPMEEVLEEYARQHPECDLSDKMSWKFTSVAVGRPRKIFLCPEVLDRL